MICGIDTGGTFTDLVLLDADGMQRVKVPSTPDDFSIGFFNALESAASSRSIPMSEFVRDIEQLVYGTTVATNIMVERTGATAGLLATHGFGDTLSMMRSVGRVKGLAPEQALHLSGTSKPRPIIRRQFVREAVERVDWRGQVVVALDEEQCRDAIASLIEQGAESLAIAFLWSFRNPAHERRAREIALELKPDLYVTCSSDVAPKWGEYERTAATAINAYVGPRTKSYLNRIAVRAADTGFQRSILIIQTAGGAMPIEEAGDDAVRTIGSGPTAGVIACLRLASELGVPNAICADVGGTTFDVGLIHGGEPVTTATSIVDQYEYFVPAVDIESIGAGGGSIAWVEEGTSSLHVGPMSAGARPGPAAYGFGGAHATVTDAAIVLGYLSPTSFLGGRLPLDRDAAERVVGALAKRLDMTLEQAAAGIVRVAEAQMADLVRKVTIQRGYDPSDFALFAYGGAGPVHAGAFGAELGVQRLVIPMGDAASLWSAYGAAASDLVRVYETSRIMDAPFSSELLEREFTALEAQARDWLRQQAIHDGAVVLRRSIDLRYKAQFNDVTVDLDDGALNGDASDVIVERFERRYADLNGEGAGYAAAGIEASTLRVRAVGQLPKPVLAAASGSPTAGSRGISRPVYWLELAGWADTPVVRGEDVAVGETVPGPAIVEFDDTTLVVRPGHAAKADGRANFELTTGSA